MVTRMEYGERWTDLLRYFERHDGNVQARVPDLADALGWPTRTLLRHLSRMEQLRVITVTRTGEFGGRYPNTYTLNMTVEDWDRDGGRLMRNWRKARRADVREQQIRAEGKVPVALGALPPPSRAGRVMAQIEERLEATLARPGDSPDDPEDLDTFAWLAGGE